MALTKQNWKDILDQIYNNGNFYESYRGDNKNGILLYTNSLGNVDVVYRYESTQSGIDTYIIGIFPKTNWAYTDEQTQEQGVYVCKVINDDIVSNQVSQIYARGASGWLNIKSYIRNILVFLGLKTDKDFDEKNPALYSELVNICHKYFSTGKAPYYFGKYIRNNSDNYSTYVQLGVVRDIAIYLNNLGVFGGGGELPLQPLNFPSLGTANNDMPYYATLDDYYDTFNSLDEFLDYYFGFLSTAFPDYAFLRYMPSGFLDVFKLQFENEFDFSNNNYALSANENILSSEFKLYMSIREFPKEVKCCAFNTYDNDYDFRTTKGTGNDYNILYLYNDSEFISTLYSLEYNSSSDEYSHSKTTTQVSANTKVSYTFSALNIKPNKYIKTYNSRYTLTGINNYRTIDAFPSLKSNIVYNKDDLNLLSFNYYMRIAYFKNDVKRIYQYIIDNSGTGLITTDCLLISNSYLSTLYIVNNFKWLTLDMSIGIYLRNMCVRLNSAASRGYYMKHSIRESYHSTPTINFNDDVSIIRLDYSNNIVTRTDLTNVHSIVLDRSDCFSANLGQVITTESLSFEGIEKISDATYPSSVIDDSSFMTFVNSVNGASNPIRNPYSLDGELQDDTHVEMWLQCTTYKNPPATQSEAITNDLNDMSDDEVDELEKTIDPDVDPDEEDDTDSDDEKKPGENEGNSTIPTINDVFKYNMSQFQTQWVLSEAEFQALGLLINSSDFLTAIAMKIAGILGIDPLSGIVSVQVAPISLTPSIDTTLKTMVIRGIEMSGEVEFLDTGTKSVTVQGYTLSENVKEFDLGEQDISTYFNSYMDLVDTQMTLYLPFIGNIDLDIRDFYDGSIWIKGFAESFTGQIVYYIIAKKDNQTRIVSTVTGNCYSTIPLNQDSYGSIMNSFTRG